MRLRIKRSTIKYIFAFLPFLTVSSYLLPGYLSRGLMIYRSIVSILYIYLYVKYKHYSKADIVFFAAHIVILISTLIHGGQTVNQFYRTLSVIGFCSMCSVNLRKKSFFEAVSIYGVLMTVLTLVTMFVYYKPGALEGGMRLAGTKTSYGRTISGNWYLLGLDNSSFFYIFTILIFLYLYLLIYKEKIGWGFFALYFAVTVSFIHVRSATAVVCFMLGGILLVIVSKEKTKQFVKYIDYKKSILTIVVFAVFIVYLRMQYIFETLIVDILGKNLTLTRRTQIWDLALKEIAKRPFFGIGAQSDLYNFLIFRVNHVHNIVLEWLYEGGIIGFSLFMGGILLFGKKINRNRSHRIAIVLSGAVAIYFLNTGLDYYTYVFLPYSFFIFIEHCDDLIKMYEINHNNSWKNNVGESK